MSLAALSAQTIDFSSASDYTSNFRFAAWGSPTPTIGVVNGALQTSSGSSTSGLIIYDTTPGDGKTTQNIYSGDVTISFDFTAAASDSVGLVFTNAAESAYSMPVVSMDNGTPSSDELIRFFNNTSFTSSAGTQVGSSSNVDSGAASGQTVHVVVTLSFSGTTPTVTMTAGSAAPVSYTYASGQIPTSYEIGFRFGINSANTTAAIDNIVITQVPEPEVVTLIGLGLLGAGAVSFSRRLRVA